MVSSGSALPVLPDRGRLQDAKKRLRSRDGTSRGRLDSTLGFSRGSSTSSLNDGLFLSSTGLSWTETVNGSSPDMTRLSGVLMTLLSIVRKQLVQPPQRPLFVPPKHLGYPSLDKRKKDGGPKKYYPQTVRVEDTEKYLLKKEIVEIEEADKKSKKIVLGRMQTASADKQRYAFDRSAGNYVQNAMEEEKRKKEEKMKRLEEGVESEEQVVALRSEGLWIKQQSTNMDHRVKRLEHLLHLLETEQKKEIAREMEILKAGEGAEGMYAPPKPVSRKASRNGKRISTADDGQVRHHRTTVARITSERMDTADKIMRILQDYDLVSGAQMATYLMNSLGAIAGHPQHAAAMYRSSMSGITDPKSYYMSKSKDSLHTTHKSGGTLLQLETREKKGKKGPKLMRTPRGKYIPIQQDSNGMVVDMGYNKGRGNFGRKGRKKSGYIDSQLADSVEGGLRGSSPGSTHPSNSRASTASSSGTDVHLKKSEIPDGPMSRRGRAAMYRNYRSLLVQEAGDSQQADNMELLALGKGRGPRGGTGANLDITVKKPQSALSNSAAGRATSSSRSTRSLGSSNFTETPSRDTRRSSLPHPKELNDLAPNWFPHMGTMPAPVGVAERALRNPNDPNAGKRDGRGLPPEEVLPDDNQPFEGRVRWFAKEGDLNFYPMLTAPSFSRSFAADKIIRKMLEEKKQPKTMSGMPAYRLSMPMAGAGTYGESANSFSFLVGRPMQPKH